MLVNVFPPTRWKGKSTHLGNQTLEKGRRTLVARHVGQDTETALGVIKIAVLDARLDDVERGRYDERCRRTGDGCDKVLEPRRLVVVLQAKEELLGECRTTEELDMSSVS